MNSNFTERLKSLRAEKNISQKKLAEELFVSQQTIAKWETDKSTPNPDTITKISDFFEVSTDYLLGKSDFRTHLDEELSQEEFALYGEVRELTTAEKEKIMEFIKFTKSIRKNNE